MKHVAIKNQVRNAPFEGQRRPDRLSRYATATAWSQQFTHKHVMATPRISTTVTRAGKKTPRYELLDLKPIGEPLAAAAGNG